MNFYGYQTILKLKKKGNFIEILSQLYEFLKEFLNKHHFF